MPGQDHRGRIHFLALYGYSLAWPVGLRIWREKVSGAVGQWFKTERWRLDALCALVPPLRRRSRRTGGRSQ